MNNQSAIFADLLNNYFRSIGSKAAAKAIQGTVSFTLDDNDLCYAVNLRVSLGEITAYYQLGSGISPFAVCLTKIEEYSDNKASQTKLLYSSMEEIAKWQLERMLIDQVVFKFAETPKPAKRANSSNRQNKSAPEIKKIPASMRRPPKL